MILARAKITQALVGHNRKVASHQPSMSDIDSRAAQARPPEHGRAQVQGRRGGKRGCKSRGADAHAPVTMLPAMSPSMLQVLVSPSTRPARCGTTSCVRMCARVLVRVRAHGSVRLIDLELQ